MLKPQFATTESEKKFTTWRDKFREISIYILVVIVCVVITTFAIDLSIAIVTPLSYLKDFLIKYLAAPLAVILGVVVRSQALRKGRWRKDLWFSLIANFSAAYLALALFIPVLTVWINAAYVQDETLVIRGTVLSKGIVEKSRSPDQNLIRLRSLKDGLELSLDVPYEVFVDVPSGAVFSACYRIGLLGIPFQWRSNYRGSCSYSFEGIEQKQQ